MKEYVAEPLPQIDCDLGEGPFYNAKTKLLHFIDINNQLLNTLDLAQPDENPVQSIKLSAKPGCAVNSSSGDILVALPGKIARVANGSEKILIEISAEPDSNRMNDGKCDTAGRFWFGSMSLNEKDPTANLWMLDNDLKLHHKLSGCTISNGIAWDKAHRHMYYIDTPTNRVDVFDYDHDSGAITNRREAFKNIWGGHFDGMTIDADDNLYIALWAGARVIKVSTTGELLASIILPEVANVTSCTFAGADLQTLYITTAKSKDAVTQQRNAGKLFKIMLSDAKGLDAAVFAD